MIRAALQNGAFYVALVVFAVGAVEAGACSSSSTPLQTPADAARKAEFCEVRAAYKLAARAANGALDPAPGSPRAVLETAEDLFCAQPSGDAGK